LDVSENSVLPLCSIAFPIYLKKNTHIK
jgi:hypothetical protein